MPNSKKRIAVFFGGRSPEHDVSIVSGLQALSAIDSARYDAFPVYVGLDGTWLVGEPLRQRANYMPDAQAMKQIRQVSLDVSAGRPGRLVPVEQPFIGSAKAIEFDCAVLAFHGLLGEDGNMQGLMELTGIPYTGMRTTATGVMMDKVLTKRILNDLDIPHLPYAVLKRPAQGYLIPEGDIARTIEAAGISFPVILKPSHLGSSIGIAKVNNVEELRACLPPVFEYDDTAIVEPFVQNLVEYNVAVARFSGQIRTSAIERPKTSAELLDFKEKYLSGGGSKKGGAKTPGQSSEGMLSLTRDINPQIDAALESKVRDWGKKLFDAIDGTGAPRIDFIGNSKSGEIWLNEVNPIPGSFGYFLWEAAQDSVLFGDFLTGLIEEAFSENKKRFLPKDPVPADARLFKRKT